MMPIQVKKPQDASAQIAVPRATKNSRKTLPSSWPRANAEPNRASASRMTMTRISTQPGSRALIGSLIGAHLEQQAAGGQQQAAHPGDPAAGVDVDQPAALYGDEHRAPGS